MRLTVSLDDDLYSFAKAMAKAEDCSISAAVNRLLRLAIEPRSGSTSSASGDLPTVRCRSRFTAEDVNRLEALDDRT
jgi:hypothetical protein